MPESERTGEPPAEVTQLSDHARGSDRIRALGNVETFEEGPAGVVPPAAQGTPTAQGTPAVPCDEASAVQRGAPEGEPTQPTRSAFRALGERERFVGGFLRVVTGTFVGPDGFIFDRDIVRHPGAVVVVPLAEDRRHVLCVRQFRAAVGETLLELPAGKLDVKDEPPETCAERELEEEIGYRASTWTALCQFYNSPGFSDERSWCFLAEGLVASERSAQGVEERHMTIERVDLEQVDELVAAGEILDAKTIVGLTIVRERLRG